MNNKPFSVSNIEGLSFTNPNSVKLLELDTAIVFADPAQPRKHFDEESLNELATSIKKHGQLQPIRVRQHPENDEHYLIVAGERRFRACKKLGVKVMAIRSRGNYKEEALIENVQREDLNPLEEATGLKALMDEYGYTQEVLAETVGKSKATISETLSLLDIPEAHREKIRALNIRKSILREIVRMEPQTQEETLVRIEQGETLTARDVQDIKKGRLMTPAKLAIKALKVSIDRLGAMDSKPKMDEVKALRDVKNRLDAAYKEALAG